MTLSRPMFPPAADRPEPIAAEHLTPTLICEGSTCAGGEQVATSFRNGTKSEPLNGVFETPLPSGAGPVAGGVYVRTDIAPEKLFEALGRLRSEAEAEIERLLAFLDELDADADLEHDGDELDPSGDEDEPNLGASENHPRNYGFVHSTRPFRDTSGTQLDWAAGEQDDREGDAGFDDRESDELEHGGESEREDHELSGDEDEPSLGSFDRLANQEHGWRQTLGSGANGYTRRNGDFEADATI